MCTYQVVYVRNHYFSTGPIQKPKPKLVDAFSWYRNWYRNHISKGESSYQYQNNLALIWGIFFIIKGALKTEFPCKFWILLDFILRSGFIFMLIKIYILLRSGKQEKNWRKKIRKENSFSFGKKNWLPYRYRNWTLVAFPIPKPGFGRKLIPSLDKEKNVHNVQSHFHIPT